MTRNREVMDLHQRLLDARQSLTEAHGEIAKLNDEIDAAWSGIENGFDIESRAELEKAAKTNGFKYGLAQAVHHIWKRNPKVEALTAAHERLKKHVQALINAWNLRDDIVSAETFMEVLEQVKAALASPEGTPKAEPNVSGQDFPCLKCGESCAISWETMLHTGICDKCAGTPSAQDGR